MLRVDSKNINYNGASVYDQVVVANFYGSKNNENISVNINMINLDNIEAKIDTIKSDIEDFIDEILSD